MFSRLRKDIFVKLSQIFKSEIIKQNILVYSFKAMLTRKYFSRLAKSQRRKSKKTVSNIFQNWDEIT